MRSNVVVLILLVGLGASPVDKGEPGFRVLFGDETKDLSAFRFFRSFGTEKNGEAWSVKNGLIVCDGKKRGDWLSTKETYRDFILRLDYRHPKDSNSGVFLRVPPGGDPSEEGMEIQILDDDTKIYGPDLSDNQRTGAIYGVVAPRLRAARPPGEWNALEIVAKGKDLTVVLNGRTVIEQDLAADPRLEKRAPRGYLGLQNHGQPIEFRRIRLKALPD